jgi:hypothetical protein
MTYPPYVAEGTVEETIGGDENMLRGEMLAVRACSAPNGGERKAVARLLIAFTQGLPTSDVFDALR